ncbi:MAG TPA: hypothetical protein VKV77_01635 [Methylovirgula sp.]|nr:hypothetical protein [Methylovirgula sp.]
MAQATIDHEKIRRWAEKHGGKPAAVERTHQDDSIGIIRIMFPKAARSEHENLVEISWDEFFEQFEESGLALLYEEDSLFSKIIGRDTLEAREQGEHASRHHPDGRRRGERREGHRSEASESADLKSREYKDAAGEVHHHTRTYQQEHGKR